MQLYLTAPTLPGSLGMHIAPAGAGDRKRGAGDQTGQRSDGNISLPPSPAALCPPFSTAFSPNPPFSVSLLSSLSLPSLGFRVAWTA